MLGIEPAQLQKLQGKRFLIVDDEKVNTQFFVHFFEDMELELEVAHDGREAVERVLAQSPGYYAAVLMDIRMPQMSGTDATLAIRSHQPWADLPIIAMSGNCQSQDRQHYLDCGMVDLLPKPAELKTIIQTLLKWAGENDADRQTCASIQNNSAVAGGNEPQPSQVSVLVFEQLRQRQQQLVMEQASFKRLLEVFLVSLQHSRQQLIQAAQHRDAQQLQAWAHKLAGACANIGLINLQLSLKSVEQRCQDDTDWTELQADWVRLEPQLVELEPLIEQYIDG